MYQLLALISLFACMYLLNISDPKWIGDNFGTPKPKNMRKFWLALIIAIGGFSLSIHLWLGQIK